jgi:ribosomal protein L37E
MLGMLIVPIAMVAVGMAIPFFYMNMVGVVAGVAIAASSILVFRNIMKSSAKSLSKQYEQTITSLMKDALVCPKCRMKWEVGAQSCAHCGFSASIETAKAVKNTGNSGKSE